MSPVSFLPKQAKPLNGWWKQRLRFPIVLIGLLLILFFTTYLVAFVPMEDVSFRWQWESNFPVVFFVPDNSSTASFLQPDDVLLAIDGHPATWHLWKPLYKPGVTSFVYTVERNSAIYHFTELAEPGNFELVAERLVTGAVSLLIWLVATLVLLFATPQNKDAWQLGLTTLSVSVILAASEAAQYSVPGSWLFSYPFMPLIAVALAQLAFLPRNEQKTVHEGTLFNILYIFAAVLGALAIVELVVLYPRNMNWAFLTGVSLYALIHLSLAIGGLAHLAILINRYWHMSSSFQRQQVKIISIFTATALLPGLLLTILPRILFDAPLLPWHLSIALLALIPAGYGYVIYRRNYLNLDVFVTHSLTYMFVALFLLSAYSLINHYLQRHSLLSSLDPFPGTLLMLPVLLIVPYGSRRIRGWFERIVFNYNSFFPKGLLQTITSSLATEPQMDTLGVICNKVCDHLQVRQAAMFLTNKKGELSPVYQLRVEKPAALNKESQLSSLAPNILTRHQIHYTMPYLVFTQNQWVETTVPLLISEELVGIFCLGPPVPDGYLNARQIDFLRQVAGVMSVAVEAMRLFDSSRAMSRELLRIRDAERVQVAAQIHDEPLQRITLIANQLGSLSARTERNSLALIEELNALSCEAQATSKQLRDICVGLHPPLLQQGAQWAVKEVGLDFRDHTGLDVELDIDIPTSLQIPQDITISLYYILRESLNNVKKHARATAVRIALSYKAEQLVLAIADDGAYSETSSWSLSALVRAGHLGLVGMHEWASMAGGKLKVEQQQVGGTIVTLNIPFAMTYASA